MRPLPVSALPFLTACQGKGVRTPYKVCLQPRAGLPAIAARLAAKKSHSYVGDAVLDAIDGCVTTFVVVLGVSGAHLPHGVALGVASNAGARGGG